MTTRILGLALACGLACYGQFTNAKKLQGKVPCSATVTVDCIANVTSGGTSYGGGGGPRSLWNGNAAAAIYQAGVAATAFSLPSANAPTPTADADGTQSYLVFTAGADQTVYARTELPGDWAGTLNLMVTGYSTGANNPTTFAAYIACESAGASTNPTYGTAQAVSLPISTAGASGRARVVKALTVTNGGGGGSGTAGACAATDSLYLKLVINANTTDLRMLSAQVTE